ncbi:hypothetical protein PHMEG_00025551 [Phytophthora megakarya]|uniref:Reverse transcriptase n=1 Tax=Phytophthora megakarya TaxID=4795 RepID=A0A225VBR6_9STRA|nr:hypothetical protein PHMEG_00025551 [Phytophthora megakarya]
MSLSACIEQGTMVRICGFEIFKEEKNVSESEWQDYFLSARVPNNIAYKTLDKEVKTLCMDTSLLDAESRLSRLMAEFYEIVDRLNMEDVIQVEPKKVVGYLVDALRPPAFKSAVKNQLGRQIHKPTKANTETFLMWLRKELEDFMRFEAHITPRKLLAAAQKVSDDWDTSDVDDGPESKESSVLVCTGSLRNEERTPEENVLEDAENQACFPDFISEINAERKEIRGILLEKVDEARRFGASVGFVQELEQIFMQLIDVFCISIGRDPPVDMPPIEVKLKPGTSPVRRRARRYSPTHREFLKKHIEVLIAAGLCYHNTKSSERYRMTADVRGPNKCVEPVVWPMPILETVFEQLRGTSRYFSLDFFKGFWQFAMAEGCQEIYSILTEKCIIMPTRVLVGGTNSVAYT